jgi:hypothetical protein
MGLELRRSQPLVELRRPSSSSSGLARTVRFAAVIFAEYYCAGDYARGSPLLGMIGTHTRTQAMNRTDVTVSLRHAMRIPKLSVHGCSRRKRRSRARLACLY